MREAEAVSLKVSKAGKLNNKAWGYIKKVPGCVFFLAGLIILFSLSNPLFLSEYNLQNLGIQYSVLAILSFGMTLVILTEGIDLSVGNVLSLAGVVIAILLHSGVSIPIAILAGIGVGTLFGCNNGFWISTLRLPPFVITLASMGMAKSIALVLSGASSIPGFSSTFRFICSGLILNIPCALWITMGVFVAFYTILYHTVLGTSIFGLGGNEEGVRFAGINVVLSKFLVYVLAGMAAGVGAVIMTARLNAAHPWVCEGFEFDAICAVIVGGTSFIGGEGGLFRTLLGVAVIAILRNGLNLVGVHPALQVGFIGLTLISAVAYDSLRRSS